MNANRQSPIAHLKCAALAALVLLFAGTAPAQYRYTTQSLTGTTTNSWIAANTLSNYNATADVGASTRADVWMYGRLVTNNVAGLTNPITAYFDRSLDGRFWTNPFTLTMYADSNNFVWATTNVWITNAAHIRHVSTTNGNSINLTNYVVKVGNKVGL